MKKRLKTSEEQKTYQSPAQCTCFYVAEWTHKYD